MPGRRRYRGGMAEVIALTYYPVKSCAGVTVSEAMAAPAGLAHDRSFMVIDESGVFRSQRRDPRMALIRPDVSADGGKLTLNAPGTESVRIDVDRTTARRDVTLFSNPHKGIDQGDEVAGWLSEVLGAPSRLVRVPPEHDRVSTGETPGTSGYSDNAAILLIATSSLDLLNVRIAESGGEPVPMDRFRPNIVVRGWDEPHTEDKIRQVGIGGAEMGYAKLDLRCAVTTVDQQLGVKMGPEPLRSLAGYRRVHGGVAFGTTFAVTRPGRVAVGDVVTVGKWGEAEL